MATAPPSSLQLRASDVIRKEHLDDGGFGEVYLCYHATLGHVVMKTMYTGPLRNEESKRSLLEEGSIMASLNHERVVRLLGVIMEDRGCSLVMELMPRGNLLSMLEKVTVPVSIKGRIIVEILEGLVYLTNRKVIHKDIKPENILIDKDFHIKIADLGLATCKTWSKLSKEESYKKSRMGLSSRTRAAGTLSYMAPEHLESIHAISTEKSDVYSFAIVVWVIITGKEPYANARNEDQISQCVRNGDRPAMDLIPANTPAEIIQLMERCWIHNPLQRPTFQEGYNLFHVFYIAKLKPYVETDLIQLRTTYEGPDELVDKMKSLSITDELFSTDCPAFLESTDRSASGPVEASIEDIHGIPSEPNVESVEPCIETDAEAFRGSSLEDKLQQELDYHRHGSYNCGNHPDSVNSQQQHNSDNLLHHTVRQPEQNTPFVSSVHSWTKVEPVQPSSQNDARYHPARLNESMTASTQRSSPSPISASIPSLPQLNQQHPDSHYLRQQSWPASSLAQTTYPDYTSGFTNNFKGGAASDSGPLYICNARGIQIGNYNSLNIHNHDCPQSVISLPGNNMWTSSQLKEGILKYEDHPVTVEHLDVLKKHIGAKWKCYARRLGLSDVEIETIEHDFFLDGLPEMVHQTLQHWKMKEGSIGCTVGKLCRALEGVIDVHVIQKILNICGSSC
ncbi:receptor-interacting serine/threonine-protein kinase 1 [Dunckerocampus dactyliophorus]|uniref:receptor-interacting serine/threonine-protein kinase 1 n=1 Tax=Dunckerocampus dactyliophorus TaxID=161453 RepID=UPI00240646D4|nr:receptor-interacting serine/threonine-protein kinase 1 [Dunckerocampus dactyliophorus]XP_054624205.1 receptor-interacting serine/threonine-protein kinase 1 [Dunckerocampus dactyliophorus]